MCIQLTVQISSNEVKRLARMELDSLARNGDISEVVHILQCIHYNFSCLIETLLMRFLDL